MNHLNWKFSPFFFPSPILGRAGENSDGRHQVNLYDKRGAASENSQRQEFDGIHTCLHRWSRCSALLFILLFGERTQCKLLVKCQKVIWVYICLFYLECWFSVFILCSYFQNAGGEVEDCESLFRAGVGRLQPSGQSWPLFL